MHRIALGLALLWGASATPAFASFYDLLTYAREGDLAGVRAQLAAGEQADPFGPGDGYSPLQWAASHDDVEMATLLLAAGADPDYRDHNGDRPLLWAADQGSANVLRVLLDAGSPPNSPDDPYARTPLMEAASSHSVEAVEVLLDAGADVAARDQTEMTALHYATWQGTAEAVQVLLEAGADPNALTEYLLETPLHYAAWSSDGWMVHHLLLAGSDPNARNSDGHTPLWRSVQTDSLEAAQWLLEGDAMADARDQYQRTPLMEAARQGRVAMAELLLRFGADPQAVDADGRAAADYLTAPEPIEPIEPIEIREDHTPRKQGYYPPDPKVLAELSANHDAIRKLLAKTIGPSGLRSGSGGSR